MKDIPIQIPKGTLIAHVVATNIIPETIVVGNPEAEETDVIQE